MRTLAHCISASVLRNRALLGVAALLCATIVLLLLMRPVVQLLRSDTVQVELGIQPPVTPQARQIDEMVLASIERGTFAPELRSRLARSAATMRLPGFYLDRCEVRQRDFEQFVRWRGGQRSATDRHEALVSISVGHRITGLLNSPVTGVNFHAAAGYCTAAGGRLPWAEELEAAAAGTEGRLYAWGDDFDPAVWPYQDADRNASRPCGAYPESRSLQGVSDLNGNAMEWGAGSLRGRIQEPRPSLHGAPAVQVPGRELYALNAAWLEDADPMTRNHHLGFRCAYDRLPGAKLPWTNSPVDAVFMEAGSYRLGMPAGLRLTPIALLLPAGQQHRARELLRSSERRPKRLEVGRCEVSRREYQAFLADPLVRAGFFANTREPRDQDYVPNDWEEQLEHLELPVVGLNWWAADAYARWVGGRLPSMEEWQLLAAGGDGRLYPWGGGYDPAASVTGDLPQSGLRACMDEGLKDVSVSGVRHLAGNVSEWTQSLSVAYGNYAIWVQGGNWLLPGEETAHSAFGRLVPLHHRSAGVGLRVVYD